MLVDNPLRSDRRVEREAQALTDIGWEVQLHAVHDLALPKLEQRPYGEVVRSISPVIDSPLSMAYVRFKRQFAAQLNRMGVKYIHAHDHRCLDLAVAVKKLDPDVVIIYDAHEYLKGWPLYKDIKGAFNRVKGYIVYRWSVWCEARNLPTCDALITVSRSLCSAFTTNYALKIAPILIRNIPGSPAELHPVDLHEPLRIPKTSRILVHSGNVYHSDDRVAMLIKACSERPNVTLLFICNASNRAKVLRVMERFGASIQEKVRFMDYPDSHDRLMDLLAGCDAGIVHTWQPDWPSHWLSLPNRIMEYTLCRLPILATRQPEFVAYNEEYRNCVLYDGNDLRQLKEALERSENEHDVLKQAAVSASTRLSWREERKGLLDLYQRLSR